MIEGDASTNLSDTNFPDTTGCTALGLNIPKETILELCLPKYNLGDFGVAVEQEYQELCKSLGFEPTPFEDQFNLILSPLKSTDLPGVLTKYSSLSGGQVQKRIRQIASTIPEKPYEKIAELYTTAPDPIIYARVAGLSTPSFADFEKLRFNYRLLLEIAVGHRVAGDQNANELNDYEISNNHFMQIIRFATSVGDLPLLVEATRHMVNLKVSQRNYYQQHLDNGTLRTEHMESALHEQIEADHMAKHLCLLASSMFNVLQRADKDWVGKGEVLGFNSEYWYIFKGFISEHSNVRSFAYKEVEKRIRKALGIG